MNISKVVSTVNTDRISDSRRKVKDSFKKNLKHRILDTETTEEAVEVAVEALEEQDPETVVEAVVEILAGVIDDLTGEEVTE